jgi:DNA-directed RNA polymerase specialized sigma24 family protein
MRPHAQPADNNRLTSYQLIANRYLRYILIRCTAYTNDRTVAQRIAAYTLITTCLLSDRLRRMADLGVVIDTMIEMVGQDQAGSEKGIANSEENVIPSEAEESGREQEGPLFVLDARMCEVAGAVNGLERLQRQVLILHHIEGMEVPALAEINKVSPRRVEKTIAKGEREFVELLRGMSSWDHVVDPDVHSLLNDLVRCLDPVWTRNLATFALHYAAEHRE